MARKHRNVEPSGRTILLVDDDPVYLVATTRVLQSCGHHVIATSGGAEALAIAHSRFLDLILLDYSMPGMTGEEFVYKLREFAPLVQVVLQTGYASERPPRDMLKRLDIQGYYDKADGPERLLLWTDAALKAASAIQRLDWSRRGLGAIVDTVSTMHRIRPLGDLYSDIVQTVCRFAAGSTSKTFELPKSTMIAGFVAEGSDDGEFRIRVGCGRFENVRKLGELIEARELAQVRTALQTARACVTRAGTVLPMQVGEVVLGGIYLDVPVAASDELEMLRLLVHQATVALHNLQLYEMAALDPLTGVHARRFFENWMRRELRTAFRSRQSVAVLMVDLDKLKRLNDERGHLCGDAALAAMGRVLREVVRENDVVGRFGGDEFVIVLPQTDLEGATQLGVRLLERVGKTRLEGADDWPLACSVGATAVASHDYSSRDFERPIRAHYFQLTAEELLAAADKALYRAKREGGGRLVVGEQRRWPGLELVSPPDSPASGC